MSFILLSGHINLTLGTHFCDGTAVETKIMLGESHLGCGMMEISCDDSDENGNEQVSFDKAPCCKNEFHTIQSSDDFVKDAALKVFNIDFAVAFLYTTLNLDLLSKATHQFYTEYISPPLEKDIQVLFQTFLI